MTRYLSDSNSEPLVVARFKDSSNGSPKLTANVTLKELLDAVNARVPVDKLYFLEEGPDGIALREAGEIKLDFYPATPPVFLTSEQENGMGESVLDRRLGVNGRDESVQGSDTGGDREGQQEVGLRGSEEGEGDSPEEVGEGDNLSRGEASDTPASNKRAVGRVEKGSPGEILHGEVTICPESERKKHSFWGKWRSGKDY